MHRRTYLGSLASTVGLAGGCLGGGPMNGAETTQTTIAKPTTATATEPPAPTTTEPSTDSPTEPDTETETPDPDPLGIERASLIWGTGGADPILRNAVASAGAGGTVILGARLLVNVDAAEFRPAVDGRIMNDAGTQIDTVSHELPEAVESPGGAFPYWLQLDTAGYETGTYTCELTATDRLTDGVSATAQFDFDLVEPLDTDDVELRSVEPETVPKGEPFTWELTFRNLADRTSDLQGDLHIEIAGRRRELTDVSWTLPALSTVTHERGEFEFDEPVTLRFDVPSHDIGWQIEVVE